MSNKVKLAIFDFDDTLFIGQSHNLFFSFLESKLPIFKKFFFKIIFRFFLNNNLITSKKNKEFRFKPYKGISAKLFNEYSEYFYINIIRPRLSLKILSLLSNHRKEGFLIVIASGGFECYIKHFVEDYNIDYAVSTKLNFDNNQFSSLIEGNECLGEEKVKRVKHMFKNFDVDWNNSFVYSDHISDQPLFNLVLNKVFVDSGQSKEWINDEFKTIRISL